MHGKGFLEEPDSIFEGEFKKGLFDGYGKYLTNGGDVYKGQFKKNKYHGFGKYNFSYTSNFSCHFNICCFNSKL